MLVQGKSGCLITVAVRVLYSWQFGEQSVIWMVHLARARVFITRLFLKTPKTENRGNHQPQTPSCEVVSDVASSITGQPASFSTLFDGYHFSKVLGRC